MAISLYTGCVIAAGAVLYANCSVAAGADTHVKGFADACYKGKKGIAKGVVCPKNREDVRRRKEVIISPVKVKLRRS